MSEILPWLSPIGALGALVYTIWTNRQKASAAALETLAAGLSRKADSETVALLSAKVDILEDRATRLEKDFEYLPSKDATHRLEVAIGELRTHVASLSERIKPVSAMADRIQEAMMDQVKFR
jgi:hypothetical protein